MEVFREPPKCRKASDFTDSAQPFRSMLEPLARRIQGVRDLGPCKCSLKTRPETMLAQKRLLQDAASWVGSPHAARPGGVQIRLGLELPDTHKMMSDQPAKLEIWARNLILETAARNVILETASKSS